MNRGLLEWLGGPVFTWELLRNSRRRLPIVLNSLTFLLFFLLFVFVVRWDDVRFLTTGQRLPAAVRFERNYSASLVLDQQTRGSLDYVARSFRLLQLGFLLALPILAASRLCQEKERDTLLALFGTELSAFAILKGKLLATLALALRPVWLLLPVFAACLGYAEVPVSRLLVPLCGLILLAALLTSATLLAGTLTRKTQEATLGTFAVLMLLYLFVNFLDDRVGVPAWLNPVDFNYRMAQLATTPPPADLLVPYFVTWTGLTLLLFLAAVVLLKPVYLDQLEKKAAVWLWRLRPAVGERPVKWREQYVLGIAPMPLLRRVPTGVALLAVMIFSTLLIGADLPRLFGFDFFERLKAGDFGELFERLGRIQWDAAVQTLLIQGAVLAVMAFYTVCVRCLGSVAEEKRMNTWDDLMATPLPLRLILAEKKWGILQATWPYLIAFAVPMALLAFCLDPWAVALVAGAIPVLFALLVVAATLCTERAYSQELRRRLS